jgi:tRNA1Val (adenine37-N6)-methyltransferase
VPREPFHFRQFSVRHERCGQPVCTDAILLGAWATVEHATRAVDVGTGCGLLALMLAQRQPRLTIAAIEIDAGAVGEARSNFAASPWRDRLTAHHVSLHEYPAQSALEPGPDLVICNPPWLAGGSRGPGARTMARQIASLGPDAVIRFAAESLVELGALALLLPTALVERAVAVASETGLGLSRWATVQSRAQGPSRRSLVEFRRSYGGQPFKETLVLTAADGSVSKEFRTLTGDFYLAFPVAPLCLRQDVATDKLPVA